MTKPMQWRFRNKKEKENRYQQKQALFIMLLLFVRRNMVKCNKVVDLLETGSIWQTLDTVSDCTMV